MALRRGSIETLFFCSQKCCTNLGRASDESDCVVTVTGGQAVLCVCERERERETEGEGGREGGRERETERRQKEREDRKRGCKWWCSRLSLSLSLSLSLALSRGLSLSTRSLSPFLFFFFFLFFLLLLLLLVRFFRGSQVPCKTSVATTTTGSAWWEGVRRWSGCGRE